MASDPKHTEDCERDCPCWIIAEDKRIAARIKTDHFCMQAACAECTHNTQIQTARNRVAELHPRRQWLWN